MYVGNAWCMKSYLRKVVLFSTIYNTGTHLQTVLFVYINYICSALILICQVVAGLYIYIYIYQGRSHGCARVCGCHPEWQLAHLKTDAE